MKVRFKFCSSLMKVMPGSEPEIEIRKGCSLRGERFSFQLAYKPVENNRCMIDFKVKSPFGKHLRLRKVEPVPVRNTGCLFDDDVISKMPGLYPDLLAEFSPEENWAPLLASWRSVWFTVDVPEDWAPGIYEISVSMRTFWAFSSTGAEPDYENVGRTSFKLEVLDVVIPPQKLKNTHWFHSDCLASYYNVPVFSEEYWKIVGNFMKSAADHGINMILTPLFTPPLDTKVGGERPTVQLVGVTLSKGKYSFDFTKLDRWISLAKKCGIKYFEMSHLFTQWGAYFTPKIIASVNGNARRIFGWDIASDSQEYQKFLDAFLPALVQYLNKKRLRKSTYFHCSDEPHGEAHSLHYCKCKEILEKHLSGFRVIDALSDVELFKKSVVKYPVPIENKLEEFLEVGMEERWTYYACDPTTIYPARFIHMPSSRNRILGTLLYAYRIEGFLHWGFNYYYSSYSRFLINPYLCNDADYSFPGGDPFLVYPGKNGIPEDSIRSEVFYEALQDQRILEKLESFIGRDAVMSAINRLSPGGKIRMCEYPRGEKNVMILCNKINKMIKAAIKTAKNRQ